MFNKQERSGIENHMKRCDWSVLCERRDTR